MVLGRRAHQRRPADVDLLDEVLVADAGLRSGLLELVEVDDDDAEGLDALLGQLGAMRRIVEVGQHAAVDARVQGLDPAVEHLRARR